MKTFYKTDNFGNIYLKNLKTGKYVKISASNKNNNLTIKNNKLKKTPATNCP